MAQNMTCLREERDDRSRYQIRTECDSRFVSRAGIEERAKADAGEAERARKQQADRPVPWAEQERERYREFHVSPPKPASSHTARGKRNEADERRYHNGRGRALRYDRACQGRGEGGEAGSVRDASGSQLGDEHGSEEREQEVKRRPGSGG